MIAKLKQTEFGKILYRLLRNSPDVWARIFSAVFQNDVIRLAHLYPANRRHNKKQIETLARFETLVERTR
ncbi:hypothetical protein MHM88_21260 [Epibacterium sp. MM17-32]|uniref:hypothetical protein n=1 Tax=Epibacterium sp. MM17-32 TaxID=2917734 RepID=UPI001EF55FC3|nr:hypothetical protein [Epibacterium sp. MM17-32]MCG7630339.1 hypothetical protein [Epibacterium sp. MM17-32]